MTGGQKRGTGIESNAPDEASRCSMEFASVGDLIRWHENSPDGPLSEAQKDLVRHAWSLGFAEGQRKSSQALARAIRGGVSNV